MVKNELPDLGLDLGHKQNRTKPDRKGIGTCHVFYW